MASFASVESFMEYVQQTHPHQDEFHQSVHEVIESVRDLLENNPQYMELLATMIEPERIISFRVPWTDDAGKRQINRGYRVQFNSAL